MEIENWYRNNFEPKIRGRYVTLLHINPLLKIYEKIFPISTIGTSVLGKEIPMIKIGDGKKNVLAWSQMHGNESTTTKAIFDFINYVHTNEHLDSVKSFLSTYSVYLIPILNPDGAYLYTRENANTIDLNRDAQQLSQPESQALRSVFDFLAPDLCLNLHDQRSIFGFNTGIPATVSFLSPSADESRVLTPSREVAMKLISKMADRLHQFIPDRIGRYDDAFNLNCVGDTFQQLGVPTILFEAGHYKQDYQRETTRKFIFYALIDLFELEGNRKSSLEYSVSDYYKLPQNKKNYRDVILRNAKLGTSDELVSIAIQYKEELQNRSIEFVPILDKIGDLSTVYAHREINIDGQSVLINNQKIFKLGDIISSIVNKSDKSLKYF